MVRSAVGKILNSLTLTLALLIFSASAFGDSEFERLVSSNNNEVPFPFSFILKLTVSPEDGVFFPPLIPYGRSLPAEAGKTSLEAPRVVVVNSNVYRPTFYGFAPLAKQVEVISWDQTAGKFEFYEVKDYDVGLRPRLVKSDRAVCIQCHQGEGPIFPRGGIWREIRKIVNGENYIGKLILNARNGDANYHGINLKAYIREIDPGASLAHFDDLVRRANFKMQLVHAVRTGCGEDRQCRKFLLEAALAFPAKEIPFKFFGDGSPYQIREQFKQLIEPRWPRDGFAYISSMLPDRDSPIFKDSKAYAFTGPFEGQSDLPANYTFNGPANLLWENDNPTFNDSRSLFTLLMPARDTPGLNDPFWKEAPLSPDMLYLANPRTPRLKIGRIDRSEAASNMLSGAFESLGLEEADFKILQAMKQEDILDSIGKGKFSELIRNWPPSRNLIMKTLFTSLGKKVPSEYLRSEGSGFSPSPLHPQVGQVKVVHPFFAKYCISCHDGGSFPPPVPFESWQSLSSFRISHGKGTTVRDYITTKFMPPVGATQPTDAERDEIIKYLDQLKNPKN